MQACGGTHPRSTAEVGAILVSGSDRYKAGTRVAFLCGDRALRGWQERTTVLQGLATLLSSPWADLPAATQRLKEQVASLERQKKDLLDRALEAEARRLLSTANSAPGVVTALYDGCEPGDLRMLASRLVSPAPASPYSPAALARPTWCSPSPRPLSTTSAPCCGGVDAPGRARGRTREPGPGRQRQGRGGDHPGGPGLRAALPLRLVHEPKLALRLPGDRGSRALRLHRVHLWYAWRRRRLSAWPSPHRSRLPHPLSLRLASRPRLLATPDATPSGCSGERGVALGLHFGTWIASLLHLRGRFRVLVNTAPSSP